MQQIKLYIQILIIIYCNISTYTLYNKAKWIKDTKKTYNQTHMHITKGIPIKQQYISYIL